MLDIKSLLKKILRKLGRLFGCVEQGKLAGLQYQVTHLEEILRFVTSNDDNLWLYRNRIERMDANVEIFDEARRRFHLQRYQFACSYARQKVIADIACGTGYGTRVLKVDGGAKSVTGLDVDEHAVGYANRKYGDDNISFKVANGEKTGLADESCDVIVSFETIEHVEDDIALVDEFYRLLKPGGFLVCSTPNNWPVELSEHHLRTYDLDKIKEILGARFNIDKVYNQNSGCNSLYNHNQPAGIVETNSRNYELAECFILVCSKVNRLH